MRSSLCGTDLLCLRVVYACLEWCIRVFLCLCYANMRASCVLHICARASWMMHVWLCVCVCMSESVCGVQYVCHVSASVYAYVHGVVLCASFCLWYAYVRVMCRIYVWVCVWAMPRCNWGGETFSFTSQFLSLANYESIPSEKKDFSKILKKTLSLLTKKKGVFRVVQT